jgi:hypothetical protein
VLGPELHRWPLHRASYLEETVPVTPPTPSLIERLRTEAEYWKGLPMGYLLTDALAALTETEVRASDVGRLREALGEICRDSNPDWTEKRVYPLDVLDDIHKIAVDAYYANLAAPVTQPEKERG